MSFITDVSDELKALIVATIPGATVDSVFSSIKAAQMNVPEKLRKGTIALPMWILDAARVMPESRFGSQNATYRMPVRIIELRKRDETDVQASIIDSLATLQSAIRSTAHTHFLFIEDGSIDSSPNDPTLAALLDLGVDVYAGTLSYEPGFVCRQS